MHDAGTKCRVSVWRGYVTGAFVAVAMAPFSTYCTYRYLDSNIDKFETLQNIDPGAALVILMG